MGRDLIDNLGRRDAIHLVFEDMCQTNVIIREVASHCLVVVQTLDNFGNVHTRFHIQVGERVRRIVEAARILLFEHIDHFHYDFARGEDLVGLLGWYIVKDVFFVGFIEIVGEFAAQMDEFKHGIIEHNRVEQVAVEMFFFTGHTVRHFSAVAQKPELVHGDAGDILEYTVRNDAVERFKCGVLVSVGHEE